MKIWSTMLAALWLMACGEGESVNAGDTDVGLGDVENVGNADVEVDTRVPDPPQAVEPCEATMCREGQLGGPPCMTYVHDDQLDAAFGVHAYASMVWDGAQTNIRVEATSGDWEPVILLARLNGEPLFDGDVGAVRPPFDVTASSPGDIVVSTAQATAIVVYVTSAEALASNFEVAVGEGAYTLTIDSDCGERLRCVVNGRDTGDPACGWLHYVGRSVVTHLDGARDQRLLTAALGSWWSLKEGLMSLDNPIARSICNGQEIGALDTCDAGVWSVGLAGITVDGRDVTELEELASRLYLGAMPSGVLRTTANEAGLNREDAAAVMATEGELRASWLLRNSAVGLTLQAQWVSQNCIDDTEPTCFGSGGADTRYYAADRNVGLQSINDLQALFDQIAE